MKEHKHYYKVVRRLASPLYEDTGLFSMYAQGGLRKRYHEGRWTFAKLKHVLRGFGLLVYTSSTNALQTVRDSIVAQTLEVWEVQVLGKVGLPKTRLDIGSLQGDYVTEDHLQQLLAMDRGELADELDIRSGWPVATIACAGVKLLQRVDG